MAPEARVNFGIEVGPELEVMKTCIIRICMAILVNDGLLSDHRDTGGDPNVQEQVTRYLKNNSSSAQFMLHLGYEAQRCKRTPTAQKSANPPIAQLKAPSKKMQ